MSNGLAGKTPAIPKRSTDGDNGRIDPGTLQAHVGTRLTLEAVQVLEETLQRGLISVDHLSRIFTFLARAKSLPDPLDAATARHFAMWLEVVGHDRFFPIITATGRLSNLMPLFVQNNFVSLTGSGVRIADVGTGQPPYTTVELCTHLPYARVHGFDLYSAGFLLEGPGGQYAVFDTDGALSAVHAGDVTLLHHMVLRWPETAKALAETFARLRRRSDGAPVIGEGWTLVPDPVRQMINTAGDPLLQFHVVSSGNFGLAPLEPRTLDAIWSFNCLLHYPPEARRRALAKMARVCRDGGIVFEGYTSPSGAHAVFQTWLRKGMRLTPVEFGWSLQNLRCPLWPLRHDDPQLDILAPILAQAKGQLATIPGKGDFNSINAEYKQALLAALGPWGSSARFATDAIVVHDVGRDPAPFGIEPIAVDEDDSSVHR